MLGFLFNKTADLQQACRIIKHTINLYYCLLKNAICSVKESNDEIISHIIKLPTYCSFERYNLFFVRFCSNSLLMLKVLFQIFSFASKKVQGFSSNRKTLMLFESLLFHLQNSVSAFWSFNKRSLSPWNQPHFRRNPDKRLLSLEKNNLKEIWDTVL